MNFDLQLVPTTFDVVHFALGGLSVILLIALLYAARKVPAVKALPSNVPAAESTQAPAESPLKKTSPESALQLLMLLQQEGRFLDFIHEDLAGFSDADIGAAARVVHDGSQKTIKQHFSFESVHQASEESRVTVPEGFNPSEIRLTGQVTGDAPFTGTLIHKGWRVVDVKLPKIAKGHDPFIVASAEVEL